MLEAAMVFMKIKLASNQFYPRCHLSICLLPYGSWDAPNSLIDPILYPLSPVEIDFVHDPH